MPASKPEERKNYIETISYHFAVPFNSLWVVGKKRFATTFSLFFCSPEKSTSSTFVRFLFPNVIPRLINFAKQNERFGGKEKRVKGFRKKEEGIKKTRIPIRFYRFIIISSICETQNRSESI